MFHFPDSLYFDPSKKESQADSGNSRRGEIDTATHLSHMLLGPVASQLGEKRLVIVSDGALQSLPFISLPDPSSFSHKAGIEQPLMLRHEIVSLPSLSVLETLRKRVDRKRAPTDLAVLADPVFDTQDERIKKTSNQSQTGERANPSVGETARGELLKQAAFEAGVTRDGENLMRLKGTGVEAERIAICYQRIGRS